MKDSKKDQKSQSPKKYLEESAKKTMGGSNQSKSKDDKKGKK